MKKLMITFSLALFTAGCSNAGKAAEQASAEPVQESSAMPSATVKQTEPGLSESSVSTSGLLDAGSLFTERDLKQTADTSSAVYCKAENNSILTITEEGVYVLSGEASGYTVRVEAGEEDKVQLILNGLNAVNEDAPVIYVLSADKVFITTTNIENTLKVTGDFKETNAVIFAKDDIVFNGTGTLNIVSSVDGISGKDDVKITGGTLNITAQDEAIEANDSVAIAGGTITIQAADDGIHSEYGDDDSAGYVYICGGTLNIEAGDDAIHATTILQIDGGTLNIKASEGLEGTFIQINGGSTTINANDDGVNAAKKSTKYTPTIEINDGYLSITMAAGDTDALDSNGAIVINGGTIDIQAQYAFDFVTQGILNGGTVTVNGTQVTAIAGSMMEGGMMQNGHRPNGH